MEGRMLGLKNLPAIFVALSATVVLTAQTSLGESTGNSCRILPGLAVPAGMHWYYHIDRADRRQCWYLSSEGRQVHADEHGTSPSSYRDAHAGRYLAVAPNDTASAAQQRPVAQTAETEVASDGEVASAVAAAHQQAVIDFAARWVEVPKSLDLNAANLAPLSNAYAEEQSQIPTLPFAVRGNDTPLQESSAAKLRFGSNLLATGLGIALLLLCRETLKLFGMLRREAKRRGGRPSFVKAKVFARGAGRWRDAATSRAPGSGSGTAEARIGLGSGALAHALRRAEAPPHMPPSFAPSDAPTGDRMVKTAINRRLSQGAYRSRRARSAVNASPRGRVMA
jgi:hypothetical protein